jgi:hypothetical protein
MLKISKFIGVFVAVATVYYRDSSQDWSRPTRCSIQSIILQHRMLFKLG